MDHPRRQTPHGETAYSPVSLLRALTANPLDVDALRGTDGAHEEASPPDTPVTRTLTVILAVVLGFVVAVSVVDLRSDATAADSPRALLQEEVRESRGDAEQLEGENDRLEAEVAQQQGAVLEGVDPESAERLAGHETAVAAGALRGPGVVLTLEDSAPLPAAPGVTEGAVNRVTDADLQLAVNGLWAAGAEAIAVNGQRLTSTSAIRTAGSAVLVDFRPLSPPYVVTALGDAAQLQEGVQDSEAGEHLREISSRYGIPSSWEAEQELEVPARPATALREATAPPSEREDVPGPTTVPQEPGEPGTRQKELS